jgi:hypothetical protein
LPFPQNDVFSQGSRAVDVDQVFVSDVASGKPTNVMLTCAHRDAIFEEIEFAFELACDLPIILQDAPESAVDREDAHHLITQLQVAVGLLDQIGWQRSGDRDRYVIRVDEGVNWFASRIESHALAALDYNRRGLRARGDEVRASVRRLIDADLEKLQVARVLRTAFMIARSGPRLTRRLNAP